MRVRTARLRLRFYFVLSVILAGILLSPLLWHLSKMTRAQADYDFKTVATEISWVNRYAPFLDRWASFREVKLWLGLNLGPREGLEQELARYGDDRHRLWLVQFLLQDGKTSEAETKAGLISSESTRTLAQGLLALAQKDLEKAHGLLQGLTGLDEKEEFLRHMALMQVYLTLPDLERAQAEFTVLLKAEPHNPAVKMLEFNLALTRRDWDQALALSAELDQKIPPTPVYLVQKGLLQIYEGKLNPAVITQLGEFPQGKSYANYLLGIKALNQGDLGEGKRLLELASAQGLPGELALDAKSALTHTNERLRAQDSLAAITQGDGR